MTIAKILCPLRGDDRGEGTLAHALAVGQRYNAHIEAIYCQARTQDLLPHTDMLPGFMRGQIEESIAASTGGEAQRMQALLAEFARANGIEIIELGSTVPRDRVTMAFRTEQGRQASVFGTRGRLADLIVVAQPDPSGTLGVNTLHSSLMNTGRPVLMCPPRPVPDAFVRHIAIGWNGSTEAARAVALAIDLIQQAEQVTAITVGDTPTGASSADLVEYLAVRGVTCARHPLDEQDNAGRALLRGAADVDADVLLMGAYSRSRGQEALFGGASHYVVRSAEIPVLLTH